MSVVSVGQLKSYMSGIRMSDNQRVSAQNILDGVQGELESYINRPIEATVVREVANIHPDGYVYLTRTPVREVLMVTYPRGVLPVSTGDVVVLPDLEEREEHAHIDTSHLYFGKFQIVPGGVRIEGGYAGQVVVDYIAGGGGFIDPYLNKIAVAILRVASREFQKMHDDTMSLRSGEATEPVDPIPVTRRGWMEDELKQFDRIRRRVVV